MVMSGSGERVVFVLDAPGDESLFTGGSIARLLADGSEVTVLFVSAAPRAADAAPTAPPSAAAVAVARAELGERDPSRWRVLPGGPDDDTGHEALASALGGALEEAGATAVVVCTTDPATRLAAGNAAAEHATPVFTSSRVSNADGRRLTAIDVSDQIDRKLRAIAAYPNRWSVDGRMVRLAGGGELLVTGTETYVPGPGSARTAPLVHADPPTVGARLLAVVTALAAGILFGVLGTVAHQTTVSLGPVTVPVGLVLALLASCTLLVGLRMVVHDRLVVLAAAIGLLATVFLLSLRSTGGSVLVPAGVLGTVWTMAPALVAALVVAWPRIPPRRPTA
jgi:LmbE family N-acetylglucosaminyl deacetylase